MTVESERTVTRAQRQAQTRERLVEVARELFLADGYNATSLDKVAVAAGFSKGAVYSNFSGKEELCMAVLDTIHEEQISGVVAAFTVDADLDGRIDAFASWAREKLGHPRWTALEVEFAAVARQSPWVATELVKRHRMLVAASADLIERVMADAGLALGMEARKAATALLSLGIGLGAMRSLDGELDVDVFAETMRALLRGSTSA
ncbi:MULTISPECIES: TetR/AcrR family transcriptional regulator [unclassified Aeromicrobium]|uniref:TetR/AcrR family transcriptional regulator n=1 Tax=unclassified Aeromicrobium TaxID=2633570 RepID=UPI0006FF656B|nr:MULTISPECIES: TetR/AcrR family transcriptional regulator [unclassified Aeromicrobium]KQO42741.1 TetR family transcriptional regulator [Aeromicrobium sp. Leaf245]KQP26734.1 TetR family transcriptional regulator [Aeromicrobium sp. Leaf272]KQP77850.1 TetR family transcriptional regulator [Aeromicrobium sp. Leaf289]KQP83487.1 TetR family transcriptional regulator [Aeromicrobium sp. Leaf291]MCR4514384.1 TetR/AcrR family transcriptional regulator [Aeromicrobium sp. 50.2.37]